jgi:excisionase family DNA binding protein
MEKICIVKRRREYAQTEVKLVLPDNQSDNLPQEVAASNIAIDTRPEFPDKKIVEEFVDNASSVISIMMTTEQSRLLKQSEYIKELLNGTKSDPSFDIKLTQDGQLAITFRFNDSLMLRMLSPTQVCQMLQVSRSFLQKLVHENKIKSYKLGRMRRFLLEDILEYLSNDSPFAQFSNEQ